MNKSAMTKPALVIMAAGMGSRFGGLKQIEPVSGKDEIILDFSLYDAMMAGFEKAVIIIKEENREAFEELLKDKAAKYMDIEYAYQKLDDIPEGFSVPKGRVKPFGTGHAVLAARKLVNGPFAVINADDYYGQTAFQVMYDYLESAEEGHYAMVSFEIENTLTENGSVARGVCRVEDGKLKEINERTKIYYKYENKDADQEEAQVIVFEEDGVETILERGTPVSMNFWGFTQGFMKELEKQFPVKLKEIIETNPEKGEFFLPFACDRLIQEGKCDVAVLKSRDKWYGVTYKEDKESVVEALQKMKDRGEYPEKLFGRE